MRRLLVAALLFASTFVVFGANAELQPAAASGCPAGSVERTGGVTVTVANRADHRAGGASTDYDFDGLVLLPKLAIGVSETDDAQLRPGEVLRPRPLATEADRRPVDDVVLSAHRYRVPVDLRNAVSSGSGLLSASSPDPIAGFAMTYPRQLIQDLAPLPRPLVEVDSLVVCLGALTIGDRVFVDYDGDGVEDASEPGLAGVAVSLHDGDGQVIAATTTDENGSYAFGDVLPWWGWSVEVIPPAGYVSSRGERATVDTSAGVDRPDIDFALRPPPAEISGAVVADLNNDGVYDPAKGDSVIEGVGITLVGVDWSSNTFTLHTVTNAAGQYSFADLAAGHYTILAAQPTGFDDGVDVAGSLAVVAGSDRIDVSLAPGDVSEGNNFHDRSNSMLAGVVFEDLNNNGRQERGELGIAGVHLTAAGTDTAGNPVGRTATTDADGLYRFNRLRAGRYTITQTQPEGFFDGADSAGTAGGTATNDSVTDIVLSEGRRGDGYNFGELPSCSVSGVVHDDAGIPIPGVSVTLDGLDVFGRLISRSASTATDGSYRFDDLAQGEYTLRQSQPDAYADGFAQAGSIGGVVDGVVDGNTIRSIALGPRAQATGYTFVETSGSLSGRVVDDRSRPVPDSVLTLTGTDLTGRTYDLPTLTDADGRYRFEHLPAGEYTVTQTQPEALGSGGETVGSAGGKVHSDNTISGIVLKAGGHSLGNNFDETTGSISGSVFVDLNNNAQVDLGEPGLEGVQIKLTGSDAYGREVTATTLTDADGAYRFDGLIAGEYVISETQPLSYFDGREDVGDAGGSTEINDQISAVALLGGIHASQYDFSEHQLSTISGSVFEDSDNNGSQGWGEPGIAGVEILLTGLDYLGQSVSASMPTDRDGNYLFGSLLPGTYALTEVQPHSHPDGVDAVGDAGGLLADDRISEIVVTSFSGLSGYNFGELPAASVSGLVMAEDGHPIEGVDLALTGTDDLGVVEVTTTTGWDGRYRFDGLRPGRYQVAETQPNAYGDGIEAAGSAGGLTAVDDVISDIVVGPGQAAADNNFFEMTGSLAGAVYEDGNGNGDLDKGETGIGGVELLLIGKDAYGEVVKETTRTDADGSYIFYGLIGGSYSIRQAQPALFTDGLDSVGSEGGRAGNDRILGIVLGGGKHGVGYNFGEIGRSTVEGSVYNDRNNNGLREPGEPGIASAIVRLLGTSDRRAPVDLRTLTDTTGRYRFEDLRPGSYSVSVEQSAGYLDGRETPGSLGGVVVVNDGHIAGSTGEISSIELPAYTTATGYDFGELTASSISGRVVDDAGLPLDQTELSLTGTDDLGRPVSLSTTTDDEGGYTFSGLRPGVYSVNQVRNQARVRGYGAAGGVGEISVDPGTDTTGHDLVNVTGSLAGSVYEDADLDGIRGSGETPISGVAVQLRGLNHRGDTVSKVTVTNGDGRYQFTNLLSGTYTIEETTPLRYLDGQEKVGSAGGRAFRTRDEISSINLGAGEVGVGYDFGELLGSSIAGRVVDDNGLALNGVDLRLTGSDRAGRRVSTATTTGPDGTYRFDGLFPGVYSVAQQQPDGYGNGGQGSDENLLSDIDLDFDTALTGYDFTETTGSLSGVVFHDLDGSGMVDHGEPTLAGARVTLAGIDDRGTVVELTATTTADGAYSFEPLLGGSYRLSVESPTGYIEAAEGAVALQLPAGSNLTDFDFAHVQPASISGVVIDDADQPVDGVLVSLTGRDDHRSWISVTATTEESGEYRFSDLRPGNYTIKQTQPSGYGFGQASVGSTGGRTSGANLIRDVIVAAGTESVDNNFSETTGSVSGRVFNDFDKDGRLDRNEPILVRAVVTLRGTDGLGREVEFEQIADGDGGFVFNHVVGGDYILNAGLSASEAGDTNRSHGMNISVWAGAEVDEIEVGAVLAPGSVGTVFGNGRIVDESVSGLCCGNGGVVEAEGPTNGVWSSQFLDSLTLGGERSGVGFIRIDD